MWPWGAKKKIAQLEQDLEASRKMFREAVAEHERMEYNHDLKRYIDICDKTAAGQIYNQILDRLNKNDEIADTTAIIKSNNKLKNMVKSLQLRLKTYTDTVIVDRYDVLDELIKDIDNFLSEENMMFIHDVKSELEKVDYYSKLNNVKFYNEEDVKVISIMINKAMQTYLEELLAGNNTAAINTFNIVEEFCKRSNYRQFVRRSVAMNNKTEILLNSIKDKLFKLYNRHSNEILDLKMDNKRLKEALLTDNKDRELLKYIEKVKHLERELDNIKVENEVLRSLR